MTASRRGSLRRVVAGAGALALAALGALTITGPASAAPNIDPDATGSVTVHKHAQPAVDGDNATGLPQTVADPLDGVEFTIYQIAGTDLTQESGWVLAEQIADAVNDGASVELDSDDDPTTVTIGAVGPLALVAPAAGTGVTGSQGAGAVLFSALDLGVYVVVEGDDTGDNDIIAPSPPFIVSVPLVSPTDTWLYDVHVYPKNSVTDVTKEVDDASAYLPGDEVSWTVTATIPRIAEGGQIGTFTIRDTFDPRLTYTGVSSVTIDGVDVAFAEPTVAGQTVTVTPDLATVNANQGEQIVVVFTTTVNSVEGGGVITNTAFVSVDGVDHESEPDETVWGALEIFKYTTEAGQDVGLEGAVFELYVAGEDGAQPADDAAPIGEPLVSDPDGIISVPVIKTGTYWVKETVAPPGYVLPTGDGAWFGPITVEVDENGQVVLATQDVPNVKRTTPDLPLTGSNGVVLFSIAGGSLLALALGGALINQRRKSRTQA